MCVRVGLGWVGCGLGRVWVCVGAPVFPSVGGHRCSECRWASLTFRLLAAQPRARVDGGGRGRRRGRRGEPHHLVRARRPPLALTLALAPAVPVVVAVPVGPEPRGTGTRTCRTTPGQTRARCPGSRRCAALCYAHRSHGGPQSDEVPSAEPRLAQFIAMEPVADYGSPRRPGERPPRHRSAAYPRLVGFVLLTARLPLVSRLLYW